MQRFFQNAINMQAVHMFLQQQDSFDNEERIKELRQFPLHVYLICRSPIIKLDNSKSIITDENISTTFYTTVGGNRKDIEITTVNNPDHPIGSIKCDYPYNIVQSFYPDGKERSYAKAGLLLRILAVQQETYFDEFNLEVLYVGQAYGKNGSRITIDRLKNHEKAQKIYFETQQKFPDSEVWFLSLTFSPLLFTAMRISKEIDPLSEEDLEHQIMLEETPIPFDQQITIAEAAIIKYFNTYQYNKEYLNFPDPEHASYANVYKLDFNSVAFEITTTSIFSKLWSKSIGPTFFHVKDFFLHNEIEREAMFTWGLKRRKNSSSKFNTPIGSNNQKKPRILSRLIK